MFVPAAGLAGSRQRFAVGRRVSRDKLARAFGGADDAVDRRPQPAVFTSSSNLRPADNRADKSTDLAANPERIQLTWKWIPASGGVTPHWSPDGSYLLLEEQDVQGLVVVDAAGQLIGSYDGYVEPSWLTDGAWLTDDEFVAYRQSSMPTYQHREVDAPAIIVNAKDGTTRDVSFPCCSALGNGHGAAAATWFLPSRNGIARPQFSVWSSGTLTDPQPGFPIVWAPAGDKLVVEQGEPGGHPYGSMEAFAWPGLKSVLQGDGTTSVAPSARFSPSGAYLMPASSVNPSNPPDYLGVLALAPGDVAVVPLAGNHSSYAWTPQDNILVCDDAGLTTYSPDGTKLAHQPCPSFITGSADGSTVVMLDSNNVPSLWPNGDQIALPTVPDSETSFWLSPTGKDLLASFSDSGFWLAQLP